MESYKSQKKIIHFSSKFKLKQKEKSLRQLDQKKREISKSLTNVVGQLKNFQEKEKCLMQRNNTKFCVLFILIK